MRWKQAEGLASSGHGRLPQLSTECWQWLVCTSIAGRWCRRCCCCCRWSTGTTAGPSRALLPCRSIPEGSHLPQLLALLVSVGSSGDNHLPLCRLLLLLLREAVLEAKGGSGSEGGGTQPAG